MKHGANASLQGSTVSSRQPDKGIIFSCFVHSHKQSRKNMNDSNTWEAMRNEPWTNNIGRKQIICLEGIVVQPWHSTGNHRRNTQLYSMSFEDRAKPSKAWHGVCIY